MCGITGVYHLAERQPEEAETIRRMLLAIRHRGPDEDGIYLSGQAALGGARLSIVDIAGGQQPICNEDGSLWVVFNGEIFNYPELRPDLEADGHVFQTRCDTEILVHMYEDGAPGFLNKLNGQFALAIWNEKDHSLFLARDRLGVRPLYYTMHDGRLIFGSEIKAILSYPGIEARLSAKALRQVFSAWGPLPPMSAFEGIHELPPGNFLTAREDDIQIGKYWDLDFSEENPARTADSYQEEFESLLTDAARIRMRADVPVGAYLSGGLDSSVTTAVVREFTGSRLETFSIAFSDPEFDESAHQQEMRSAVGTNHHVVECGASDVGRIFPDVIWHAETPLLRTSPAPMMMLAGLAHDRGYKVVVTGEGADEFLGGYDIFKEMKIRRFWARRPNSQIRPRLLSTLYPEIPRLSGGAFKAAFFGKDLEQTDNPYYSHRIRWNNTARTWRFFREPAGSQDPFEAGVFANFTLPAGFMFWSDLGRAQYLEVTTFLSTYLLSAQGDRMSMARSVEGRYPFLDHRLVEFSNRLPTGLKLPGLSEKYILRRFGKKLLPPAIWQRRKKPYRAPIQSSFFSGRRQEYVDELLSPESIDRAGYFNPSAVGLLARKAASGGRLSEIEDMALVGILSTQLLDHFFVQKQFPAEKWQADSPLKLVDRRVEKEPKTGAGVERGYRDR